MALGVTPGRRIQPFAGGSFPSLQPGDYMLAPQNAGRRCVLYWPPGAELGPWTSHPDKVITEHEDGSISVSPSILCTYAKLRPGMPGQWHGFLERGQWRQA